MKSKKVLATLVMASALLLTGCGNKENTESSQAQVESEQSQSEQANVYLKDMDVENYVTIGDYMSIKVDIDKTEMQESEIEWEIRYNIADAVTADFGAITDRAVENGDLINLDYAGYKDGVAFSGGTATDQLLGIGSDSFIDGFEDGLVGVMPGETVDLDLTFPENYGNEELNGADVVFTVTVNYIVPGAEEVSDEVVQALELTDVTNGEQLRAYVEEYMQEYLDSEYQEEVENQVITQFMAMCTFEELPADRLAADKAQTTANLEAQASVYGIDADTFVQYFYGMTAETFIDSYTESATKQLIAMQVVANKEGLGISDEELDSMLLEYATGAGYDTIEEYCGETNKETFREYFVYDKVLNFLVENATITN